MQSQFAFNKMIIYWGLRVCCRPGCLSCGYVVSGIIAVINIVTRSACFNILWVTLTGRSQGTDEMCMSFVVEMAGKVVDHVKER